MSTRTLLFIPQCDESGARRYHWLKLDSSKTVAPTGVAFKKYQQDTFTDVALTIDDLPSAKRPEDPTKFKMCPLLVTSRYARALAAARGLATLMTLTLMAVPPPAPRPPSLVVGVVVDDDDYYHYYYYHHHHHHYYYYYYYYGYDLDYLDYFDYFDYLDGHLARQL